jgi:hypothetical protein
VIYEVSENELDLLVQGAPNSIHLNFAIALLSMAVSFIIALTTTTIESLRTFTVFVVLAVVGSVGGLLLLVLWYRGNKSVSDLIETIKRWLPPGEGPQRVEIPSSPGG